MDKGYCNLKNTLNEIKPDLCILLGSKVSNYLDGKIENIIKLQHPSYIFVYKRKYIDDYINNAIKLINENLK